ncbi:MAG: hypothetical protein IIV89_02555, partial [Bacteroidaceae bacterium]|nr:hypothetical protein [Bacteroidaceae bacterium]
MIDNLTTRINELQEQLDSKSTDDEAALQELLAELNNMKSFIVALQAKDAELEQQMSTLQSYVDSAIVDTKSWADATFATLAQYVAMQTEIAGIKTLIEQYTNEATAQFTQALTDAIAASETSMKSWVNKLLADGYYDIAAIDAKLAALKAELTNADDELAKQLEDQQAALEQAKAELTAAYKAAITEAIEANNGVISKAIADAVQAALDKVDVKLAVIDNAIAAIQKDIEAIKNSIASLEQQIAGIKGSLTDLEAVDKALQQLIDDLISELSELQGQLDNEASAAIKAELQEEITKLTTLIAALQAKDTELEQQIAALKTYVDSEISATEDWANGTFATLAQYAEMQTQLAALKALVGSGNNGDNSSIEEFTQA